MIGSFYESSTASLLVPEADRSIRDWMMAGTIAVAPGLSPLAEPILPLPCPTIDQIPFPVIGGRVVDMRCSLTTTHARSRS